MGAADGLLQGWPKESPQAIYLEPDWRPQAPLSLSADRVRGGAGLEGGRKGGRETASAGRRGLTPPGAQERQSGFLSEAGIESFHPW